jgi:Protein kinase domain
MTLLTQSRKDFELNLLHNFKHIANFDIKGIIHNGNMSTVFKGIHEDKVFVIKLILEDPDPKMTESEKAKLKLFRSTIPVKKEIQCQNLASKHNIAPKIVNYEYIDAESGYGGFMRYYIIVTEKLEMSYHDIIKKDCTVELINNMYDNIDNLIQLLNGCKIMHGDLTFRNIMIDSNGETRIIDYGISLCGKDYEFIPQVYVAGLLDDLITLKYLKVSNEVLEIAISRVSNFITNLKPKNSKQYDKAIIKTISSIFDIESNSLKEALANMKIKNISSNVNNRTSNDIVNTTMNNKFSSFWQRYKR